ncbi:bifunctional transaldolase/phosoglucose isomerase [Gluconobacter morbifer]|uniref:Transaldolase n=1 Tax=Gluconobacter morbifer G707 TaxID=1088869 RepID=G6XFY2_9PROT|nr:bifunctional transaldolase/phosoglucose isomerase [Gluconobacter morbifer]EHH69090.1 transaldolase/phosoglucose isomerase [Gluconobacter morbifer G707]
MADTISNTSLDEVGSVLRDLEKFGQSPWLDFIQRSFTEDGSLKKLVEEDGLRGVTSNPAIFEKAIGHGTEYDPQIRKLLEGEGLSPGDLYEHLAVDDIRAACGVLHPVFQKTKGLDGYVSLEVSPYLAFDPHGTITEARRLWKTVSRENLMVKIPGTTEGCSAIREAIADGININVTLLFSLDAYKAVLEAYISGLEARVGRGEDISRLASVASFFVSRIDGKVDAEIDRRVKAGDPESAALKALRGKVAIANAKMAYQYYLEVKNTPRWKALAAKGANPQRLLWASTGTKDKAYSDVLYVEELIGPETVNTIPPATFDAFRDHGKLRESLTENVDEARHVMAEVERLSLDLDGVTAKLVKEGCASFCVAFDELLTAVATKREAVLGDRLLRFSADLPAEIRDDVAAAEKEWSVSGILRRIWKKDPSVWTNGPEAGWLNWLNIVQDRLWHIDELEVLARDVRTRGFTDILLLGMGGSSLGPEVLAETFGQQKGWPKLHVLDSTDPQQVTTFKNAVDLKKTLFIVASKSGGTLEPNILFAHFWDVAGQALGKHPGENFIAITDPGSHMQKVAEENKFWRTFFGDPKIGGRFSVLSNFGLVPAAAAGLDVRKFLKVTQLLVESCDGSVPPAANPGATIGLILGHAAKCFGRDKVTIVASEGIASFGAWLEQLIAESTGKKGIGLVPIDEEELGAPSVYGKDRVFVDLLLGDDMPDSRLGALREAGAPVITVRLAEPAQLGQAFFLFEFATAVAGAVLGIDPFDQPDVEFSKVETRKLTSAYAEKGSLPAETPFAKDGSLSFYADEKNAKALEGGDAVAILKKLFGQVKPGDYVGLLAYIERDSKTRDWAQAVRMELRDALKVATAAEFGPRFLHSTGQAYKGGPDSGVFLQVTATDAADVPVPGHGYSFSVVKAAQARGDFEVLAARGRRALRVHIDGPLAEGLKSLATAIHKAVAGE